MDTSESDYPCSFRTVNIVDYEEMCLRTVSLKAPTIAETIISLETFAKECKIIADRNGVEYDSHSLLHFQKALVMSIPFDTAYLEYLVNINYSFYRKFFDNFKNVLINEYMYHVEQNHGVFLGTSREQSGKSVSTSLQAETIVKKFLKVFQILKPDPELSFDNLEQYEFLAELLKFCFSADVQNSSLIVSLLKLTIDRYVSDISGVTHVAQPHYPHGFFKYILKHVTKAKFDLVKYCSDHSRTLWDYARNFSVINAASFGNAERVLCLLQHGFDIFPENEARYSGHGHPYVKDVMSRTNSMVLQIMSRMRLVNCFTSDYLQGPENCYYIATPKQAECFRLIWRSLPDPYVRRSQLAINISTEYFYLALHAIFKPFRHSRNVKLGAMYEICFEDLAVGPHEPRSLKHLSRCTIRKLLQQTWSLPNGVFQLGLPKSLEKYLNLECD